MTFFALLKGKPVPSPGHAASNFQVAIEAIMDNFIITAGRDTDVWSIIVCYI